MNLETWAAFAGVAATVLGLLLGLRYQIRKDIRDRDERAKQDTRQSVLDAVAPVAADRDYARAQLAAAQRRIEELEDQLRSRDDRP